MPQDPAVQAKIQSEPSGAKRPSLETLKKRAKQLQRWHRDGVYTVAETIRTTLPRFGQFSDSAIMNQPFRLADAQEMIARQNGFESWQALKTGYESMTTQTKSTPAQHTYLQIATPLLFVKGIDATCDFFEDVLGFSTKFKYGEPPFFASIARDAAMLNLRCVDMPIIDRAAVVKEELFSAMITVGALRELKQLYAEFTEAGAAFHQTLKKQPWGGHDFIVRDPDGNLIEFGCAD